MSAKKSVGTTLDWLKWSIVVALLIGGVVGNWYFQEVSAGSRRRIARGSRFGWPNCCANRAR